MSPIRGHSCRPYLVPPPNLASKYEPGGFPQRILCVLLDDTRSTALFWCNKKYQHVRLGMHTTRTKKKTKEAAAAAVGATAERVSSIKIFSKEPSKQRGVT